MAEHPIVHIEIPASNLQAAGKFYADLFGWKTEDIPEMSYVTFQAPPGPGGRLVSAGVSARRDCPARLRRPASGRAPRCSRRWPGRRGG